VYSALPTGQNRTGQTALPVVQFNRTVSTGDIVRRYTHNIDPNVSVCHRSIVSLIRKNVSIGYDMACKTILIICRRRAKTRLARGRIFSRFADESPPVTLSVAASRESGCRRSIARMARSRPSVVGVADAREQLNKSIYRLKNADAANRFPDRRRAA